MTTLREEALAYIHRDCAPAGICSVINPAMELTLLDMAAWALERATQYVEGVTPYLHGDGRQVERLRSMASALRGGRSEE